MKRKAAFFDRDGTLIKDVEYLSSLKDIEVLPGVIDFCLSLQKKYLLFVVTNQSGIARGFFDEKFVQETHQHLNALFKQNGVNFAHFYYCPHDPSENCLCRKPSPGMLLQAARDYNLELSESLMFGDKMTDIEAGKRAGCKCCYIQEIL